MKKHIINFSITAGLFVLFAIFTIVVKFVDTSTVAATNTQIGLSSINKPIFDAIKINDTWKTISTIMFLFAGAVVLTLAVVGIKEFIKTKQEEIRCINVRDYTDSIIAIEHNSIVIPFLWAKGYA